MPPALPTITSFWFGSDLSWLEALCIQSYLDRGHHFVLYAGHEIAGVPAGAELRHAEDILWPAPFDMLAGDRLSVAVFSDIFRLRLMQATGFIWVDLDAYCVRPFNFPSQYIFGQSQTGNILTGVLRLPANSETLSLMLEFVTTANPTQPWRGGPLRRRNRRRIRDGETWGIETLPWGSSGPKAFAHFLRKTKEDSHAMQAEVFYPLSKHDLWKLHDPFIPNQQIEGDMVHSVHVYGHQKRMMAQNTGGLPVRGSYLQRLCDRHGIDPNARPILPKGWLAPTGSKD
ncbi:hypothetical protein RUE5091_00237 [Ruegeria denitrificans]|uniref:Mannosyltransferase OCH1 n=1 Tax=Ruegeria denitrificans TaxID=1715692 RepID=A0A0P1ID73_9RHOB|nr:hypothetical protein [Ruegeria denitrificans]CUJ84590.1 hypothetical protein RUE5091_00237 [Ruegeria denitrificans]